LLASFEVAYRIASCKKLHSNGESLVLPTAVDIIGTLLGESYARKFHLQITLWEDEYQIF
jgi:hypothetical protein